MQSGQEQNQSTQAPLTHPGQASSQDLNLKPVLSGEKPLDFIKRNLNVSAQPISTNIVQDVVDEVKKIISPEQATVTITAGGTIDPEPKFFDEPEKVEPEEPTIETATTPEVQEDSTAENIKQMRQARNAAEKARKDAEAKYQASQAELEKYKTGEVVPEVLQQKENEIARLSTFEKLHNLKASPGYQEKFVKPLTQTFEQLKGHFEEYGRSSEEAESLVNQALSLDNKAQLNNFLLENFDVLGAEEAKKLIYGAKALRGEAKTAEMEPVKAIQALKEEQDHINAQKEHQRTSKIAATAKDSWVKSLLKQRESGRMPEIIYKDNDPEHNAKFVTPIVTQASTEFGKLVTMLAKSGLTELTPDVAEYLAQMTLLAHASAVAGETRKMALDHANELEANSRRGNILLRPPVGGGNPASAGSGGQPAKTPDLQTDAANLINSVVARRK